MARPELGAKRLCPNCGTKYYDLGRNPILCPKCGTVFAATALAVRARAAAEEEDEEVEGAAELPVEFVSLDEVEAVEKSAEDVPDLVDEEIAEVVEPIEDDTFLEEDEGEEGIADIDIEVGGDEEER